MRRRARFGAQRPRSISAIVDRVVQKVEIVEIDGESYRQKEAMERAERRAKERKQHGRRGRSS
ncbi:MAG: hypothetical protein U1F36_17210 [Planctomycetota bacterium]